VTGALGALVAAALGADPPPRLGVAVSGGADSMALLHLLADHAGAGGPAVAAVTVDHHLRAGSGDEAAAVGRACAALGVPHTVCDWHWDGRGNLEAAARAGRMAAIAAWARAAGIGAVALGHTADDQAETLLMRLGRGSGVDGLAAMAPRRRALGLVWLRPLLRARRAELRAYLTGRGIGWIEDPMNDDPAFGRVRARAALAALAPLGVTVEGLAATAGWMALARAALEAQAASARGTVWEVAGGDVLFAAAAFAALPLEVQLRLLAGALQWVAAAPYRPRLASLLPLHEALAGPCRRTLHGCLVTRRGDTIRVGREPRAALAADPAPPGTPWDGRWIVTGPFPPGALVRALGQGVPVRRPRGVPAATLAASPAVWAEGRLLAAPLAEPAGAFAARPVCGPFATVGAD
jgi:tRNA(Ile)-lysidine synthase